MQWMIPLAKWDDYLLQPSGRVHLNRVSADSTDFCSDKAAARKELRNYRAKMDDLLARLAAEGERSMLVVLQGVDASGKDGAIRKVFSGVNPQHCKVVSFKEPDREERAHDYMWRIYRAMPAKGELSIFNRSQYEDVLVPQARGQLSPNDALIRLRQIADIEKAWSENDIVVRKLFLHISRKEQTARFKARLDNPRKHWKIQESDFQDRKLWPKFMSVYEEALSRTSAGDAPWYIIPADHKWYRDLAVAGIVLGALDSMKPRIPRPRLNLRRLRL